MQIPIDLDRALARPLTDQLADQLRDAIRRGRIPSGARLPSSRALADQLGLARNTVVRAYEALTIDGLVESRAASGFFATPHPDPEPLRSVVPEPKGATASGATERMPAPAVVAAPRRSGAGPAGHARALYDFLPGRPSVELFPLKAWRRLLQGCLSYGGASGLSEAGDPAGLPALRTALASHLSISRGIVADPAQIVIVSGVQEGLSVAARLFTSPTVLIENPCYEGASLAFAAAGARLVGIPVDEEGLVTSLLPEEPAALLYVTPGHQYPTGHTLSLARRQDLVSWARRCGCYLVEDDYDSEFQYEGSPVQALAGMAPDCTIHLGTFSTTLGGGVRVGYVVAPPELAGAMRAIKALLNSGSPWLDQAVLAEFLRSGSYATHLTRCRSRYKESRDTLLAALRRHFGAVEISGEALGLHVLWRLPAGVPEAAKLEELARQQHVGVYSLGSAGARELGTTLHRRSLVMGYAGLVPKQIEHGIARLSDAVDDTLDDDHDFVRELLVDEPLPERRRSAARLRASARHPARQQPAIRTVAPRRAADERPAEELSPMRMVRGIYRYPIKGLSPHRVPGVELEAGKPFPFDRVFALTRPAVPIDAESPRWAKKGLFLMLMLDESLACVRTHLDVETMQLTVSSGQPSSRGDAPRAEILLRADLMTREGRESVEAFFCRQVPKLQGPPKLVHSRDGHFMDKPDSVMSCINLATVRSLETEWSRAINPLRFRANFYIEGARPWEEFDWVGSDIMLGDVLFRVDRRNGRCGATNVDPVTGERDMDIPGALRKRFGHKDLGVYLVARTAGKVVVGDRVTVPELAPSSPEAGTFVPPAPDRSTFICRGCYFIYDEARASSPRGEPMPFAAIGDDWQCPDCGTGKSNFRPYVADLGEPA